MVKVQVGEGQNTGDINLYPGKNLYAGQKPFIDEFDSIDSLENDLLNLASGIYAADLAIMREEREHYIRDIEFSINVVNLHAFERIKDLLEAALLIVSKDNWTINFIQETGVPVSNFEWQQNNGAVLLFSGGIDSMCAAAELVRQKQNVVLVSHNSHGNTVIDNCQRNVHSALEKHFGESIKHIHVKVYGRNLGEYSFPGERENTQRTRSFLFLSIAALVTRRCGFNKVLFMAENGQFAIHLPLNQSRVGPFSTHTADPEFVDTMRQIFRILLSNQEFQIINPYLYQTKAEVFSLLPKKLQEQAHLTATCWMISRIPGNKHCGYCIPCISRRIALEFNSISFDEYAHNLFTMDLNSLSDTDDKKRNIVDYLEFISKFRKVTDSNKNDLCMEFPELFNPTIEIEKALNLFERVSSQSFKVLSKYPSILKIIE